jgi:hypothetical protein
LPAYLTSVQEFCDRSPFNETQAAELEAKRPQWLKRNILSLSEYIDTRMIKRGDVPFPEPYNATVKRWVANLLTPMAFDTLGRRPSDETQVSIDARAKETEAQIKEAADPEKGLLVLPLQRGSSAVQATEPATLCYVEQSPFTSKHRQFDAVKGNRRYG